MTSLSLFTFMHWRRKWQPTPVFLPGESQDGGAWWAAFYGVAQSQTRLKQLSSSSMSTELVMPSNYLILCRPLFLPPSIFPSIRVFSNESALRIRWPKYWSFSFTIMPLIKPPIPEHTNTHTNIPKYKHIHLNCNLYTKLLA